MTPRRARRVRVVSWRSDGSPRDESEGVLVEVTDSYVCVHTPEGVPNTVHRNGRTTIEPLPDAATELYFFDRWYHVLHFHRAGAPYFNHWYANVAYPAVLDTTASPWEVRWHDLDIDVYRRRTGEIVVRDEDEFEENRVRLGFPPDVVARALAARDEVLRLAEQGAFPFNREDLIARAPSPLLREGGEGAGG